MKLRPEIILELANFHGGNTSKIFEALDLYSKLNYENLGIKFQIFKYSKIALEDFSWFKAYKEFYIKEKRWKEIIEKASKIFKTIWLDVLDVYGVRILKQNFDNIYGIKLQASVLDNFEVFNSLHKFELNSKSIIINVSGYEISKIESHIRNIHKLKPREIILQIGFQNYPTSIDDTSLNKIDILEKAFPSFKLCYADHIDGKSELAIIFPSYAYIKGVDYLEKHVCIKRSDTKYDSFSSLEFNEVKQMISYLKKVNKCLDTEFVTPAEKKYLLNSEQKAICSKKLNKGQLVSKKDVIIRRTNQNGISISKIQNYQKGYFILDKEINKHKTINYENFKKAKIAVIVACRMKSSRLKQKAILPINGVPSVERCLYNCTKLTNVDEVILATSTLEEDTLLKNYTLGGKAKFWTGHPEDVIKRYLGACEYFNIDVVIRVTADCPAVSPEIAEYLIKKHFEFGADYTAAKEAAAGSSCEIYNTEALKRVIKLLGDAKYSEYMTWYLRNNKQIFKINIVELPKKYVRDYRLTLDYEEDLNMFNILYKRLEENNCDSTIRNVFKILDNNQDIEKINSHLKLKYKTDKGLIDKLNKVTKI